MRLPLALRRHTKGKAVVELASDTVGDCLAELESLFPDLAGALRSEQGSLRPPVQLYVNGEGLRYSDLLHVPLHDGDELVIIMPIAGGAAPTAARVADAGVQGVQPHGGVWGVPNHS